MTTDHTIRTSSHTSDLSMEPLPDLSAIDKQALESLLVELYDKSCKAFGAAFDIQQEVKVIVTFVL